MERIAIGFVTEPSFLNVTPMVEVMKFNKYYQWQNFLLLIFQNIALYILIKEKHICLISGLIVILLYKA